MFKGIIVNCVCLGYIGMDMVVVMLEKVLEVIVGGIFVGCFGKFEEVVEIVVYLVFDVVGFMIGVVMSINGG